jgi:dimethylaniline monooxygenase (N-oxide forming)
MTNRRIAIIGAGASGLTSAKALLEVGITPVVYESSPDVGGLWVYREDGGGPAYRSLRTNTSKQITAFSDFPFPDDRPNFPTREEVETYLRSYAEQFALLQMIRFGCSVEAVRPDDNGGWHVEVSSGEARDVEFFDAVLVCSGIFRRPLIPAIPGIDRFQGTTLPSITYRRSEPFVGQDVLVVGLGSSAADIAIDLAASAHRVTMGARRGSWIAPRCVAGRPLDHRGTRLSLLLPESMRKRRRHRLLTEEYRRRGLPQVTEIWRQANVPFDPTTAPSVTSDELLPAIASGRLDVRPGIDRMESSAVIFADGSCLQPDTVIFATGYGLEFPFLPASLQPWSGGESGLYRLVFPPNHPTLAFVGVCRAHGPILPIVEMQARWVAQVFSGQERLPTPRVMHAEIDRRLRIQTARNDSVIRVSLLPYLDELAGCIGVRPQLHTHLDLLTPILVGPPVAAQYRLDGPHRWSGAASSIRAAAAV